MEPMDFFYFLIFLSFILSLSLTTLYEGIGTYIKNKNRYPGQILFSWTLFIWILVMTYAIVQYFIGIYALHDKSFNNIWIYLINMALVTIIFIICRMLVPDLNAPDIEGMLAKKQAYHLSDYFERNRRSIANAGIILFFFYAISYYLSKGIWQGYFIERFPFHIAFVVILVTMGYIKKIKRFWYLQSFCALISLGLTLILTAQVINTVAG